MIKMSSEVNMSKLFPPGPNRYLALGKSRSDTEARLKLFCDAHKTYGNMVRLPMVPGVSFPMLNYPDYIHYVLVDHPEQFHKGPAVKNNSKDLIGDGLLNSEGDFHRKQRGLVQPAFHHGRIANYATAMVYYAQQMLDSWPEGGEVRNISADMMALTLNIVAKTLFDADVSDKTQKIGESITAGIEYVNKRAVSPLALPEWLPT